MKVVFFLTEMIKTSGKLKKTVTSFIVFPLSGITSDKGKMASDTGKMIFPKDKMIFEGVKRCGKDYFDDFSVVENYFRHGENGFHHGENDFPRE